MYVFELSGREEKAMILTGLTVTDRLFIMGIQNPIFHPFRKNKAVAQIRFLIMHDFMYERVKQ